MDVLEIPINSVLLKRMIFTIDKWVISEHAFYFVVSLLLHVISFWGSIVVPKKEQTLQYG